MELMITINTLTSFLNLKKAIEVIKGIVEIHDRKGIHMDVKPENVLIEIGDVEQIVKTYVKDDHLKEKNDDRNGRRRRRTLITGSQPLPSPLNASFSQSDLMNMPGSTQSLNKIMSDKQPSTPAKSMLESLGIQPEGTPNADPQKEREKTAYVNSCTA